MAYAAAESLTSSSVGTVFIACYVFFFAALICCFECALSGVSRAISSNFGFMYGLAGRSFFLLFVAGMCYRLGLAGIITMALLGVSWLTYVAIRYKHPKYEEYVRKVHYAGIGQTSSKKFFIVWAIVDTWSNFCVARHNFYDSSIYLLNRLPKLLRYNFIFVVLLILIAYFDKNHKIKR